MSPSDRLALWEIAGLSIALTGDGRHLEVTGPAPWVDIAKPTLHQHRDALVAELRHRAELEQGAQQRRAG